MRAACCREIFTSMKADLATVWLVALMHCCSVKAAVTAVTGFKLQLGMTVFAQVYCPWPCCFLTHHTRHVVLMISCALVETWMML